MTLAANGVSIDTVLLPQHCERVVLVVSVGDGGFTADATAVLHQPGGQIDFRFCPADSARLSALVWGELYLRNGNWRLRAVGQGWSDGLAGLARDYGVNVDSLLSAVSAPGQLPRLSSLTVLRGCTKGLQAENLTAHLPQPGLLFRWADKVRAVRLEGGSRQNGDQ